MSDLEHMADLLEFRRGFRLGREDFHDWTQQLMVTRERSEEGSEYCVCWIGTFALITTDGGGWSPDDGAVLGVRPDGTTAYKVEWPEWFGDLAEESEAPRPRWPLAKGLYLAQMLAQRATMLLPAIDEAFEIGGSLEHLETTLATINHDPLVTANEWGGLWVVALGLLWLSEEERRRPLAGTD